MGATKIAYATKHWSVVTGCSPVSVGCQNCWARRYAGRGIGDWASTEPTFSNGEPDERPRRFSDIRTHPDRLSEPLRWRKPQVVCVAFLGDLFHEAVPDAFLLDVFRTMKRVNQHTYLLLTKRPERMRSFISRLGQEDGVLFLDHLMGGMTPHLDHVWLGVSCEDQAAADERIPLLLQTPAAHRWVSIEPMLGPVDLHLGRLRGTPRERDAPNDLYRVSDRLDWVCLGGESGPGARPMHPTWARDVRDQCEAAGVPYYHKQNGEYIECEKRGHIGGEHYAVDPRKRTMIVYPDGHSFEYKSNWDGMDDGIAMERVGTTAAGHLLDGREHRELPWEMP